MTTLEGFMHRVVSGDEDWCICNRWSWGTRERNGAEVSFFRRYSYLTRGNNRCRQVDRLIGVIAEVIIFQSIIMDEDSMESINHLSPHTDTLAKCVCRFTVVYPVTIK